MVPVELSFIPSQVVQLAVVVGSVLHIRTGLKSYRRIQRDRETRAIRDGARDQALISG